MYRILLNVTKLQEQASRIVKTEYGDVIKLVLGKLKYPRKNGVTHILYCKQTQDDQKVKNYKAIVGGGIALEEEVPSDRQFFMVFVEDGGAPTVQYTDYDEALKQADHLATKLGKKAWIMGAVSEVGADRLTPAMVSDANNSNTEVVVKKVRKRIPINHKRRASFESVFKPNPMLVRDPIKPHENPDFPSPSHQV